VRIAKADLVPTDANLRDEYDSFAELEAACEAFCANVNARPHRATARPPVDVLAEERSRLHVLPEHPVTVAFGQTRRVGWDATISVEGVRYSVPHQHVDERVWVRWSGEELVVTVIEADGPREIARHRRGQRGRPQIRDELYPAEHPPPAGAAKASNSAEEAFLAIGDGAKAWLVEAAAAGASRVRSKMAEAVAFANCTALPRSTRPSAPLRSPAGSAGPTSPRSSPTSRQDPWARRAGRVRRTACNPALPAGPASAQLRQVSYDRHDKQEASGVSRSRGQRPSTVPLDEVIALTRRLRMPYLRTSALNVVPTARAQRWDPAELLRVLLTRSAARRAD
jgi:hypothetical protein